MSRIRLLSPGGLLIVPVLLLGRNGSEPAKPGAGAMAAVQVQFTTEVRVGQATLKPGQYSIQHYGGNLNHTMRFTERTTAETVQVPCRIEAMRPAAARSTVRLRDDGTAIRLLRVELPGQNVSHFFEKHGER